MALDDAPENDSGPQGVVSDILEQHAPGLADNEAVNPQFVASRLLRQHLRGNFGNQGLPPPSPVGDQNQPVDPRQYTSPPDQQGGFDPSQYVSKPQEPAPAKPEKQPEGAIKTFGEAAVAAPVSVAGQALKGAALLGGEVPTSTDQFTDPMSGQVMRGPGQGQPPPMEQNPLYHAGQVTEKFANEQLGPTEAARQAHPIASAFGSGVGLVGSLAAAGAASPGAAIAGASALFGLSGVGETYEAAKAKGADEGTAHAAAALSGAAQAALGTIPLASVLKPFAKYLPEAAGWAVSALAKASEEGGVRGALAQGAQSAAVFGTIGEAQEFLGQQIANMYDPKAGYSFNVERLIGNLLAGGVVGGFHGALHQPEAQPQQGLGPAGPGAGPEPAPPPPPETRKAWADEWANTPGKADPGNGAWQALANQMKVYGFTEADLGNASTRDLIQYLDLAREQLQTFHKMDPADVAKLTPDEMRAAAQRGEAGGAAAPVSDEETLRRAGATDEDISNMSPNDMAAAAEQMRRAGVGVGAEGKLHPEAAPAAEAPKAGTRANPIDVKTPEDVTAAGAIADQTHTHAQGAANNIQRGHAVWNDIPITIEAPAGGMRRGIADDGTPFEQHFPLAHGYINDSIGADNDKLDLYLGPNPQSPNVYVLDEKNDSGTFRQHKVFGGLDSPGQALRAYAQTSGKSPQNVGGMRQMSVGEFNQWRSDPENLKRPISEAMTKAGQAIAMPAPEPTSTHVQAIEDSLRNTGTDPHHVRPVAIQRAAEIHEHEGLAPDVAWRAAIVRMAVEDGLLTPEQIRATYGDKAETLLGTAGGPARELHAETPGATVGGPAAPREGERVPGGGENGRPQQAENAETGQPAGQPEKPAGHAEAGQPSEAGGAEHPPSGGAKGGAATTGTTVGGERTPRGHGAEPGGEAAGAGNAPEHGITADAAKASVDAALVQFKIPRDKVPDDIYNAAVKNVMDGQIPLAAIEQALIDREVKDGILTIDDLMKAGATEEEVNALTEGTHQPGETATPENAGAAETTPEHAETGRPTPGAGAGGKPEAPIVGGERGPGRPEPGPRPEPTAEPKHEPAEPTGGAEHPTEPAGHPEPAGEPRTKPEPKPVEQKSADPIVQSILDAAKTKAPIVRLLKAIKSGETYEDAAKAEPALPKILDNKKLFPQKPAQKHFEAAAEIFDERTQKGKFQDTGHIGGARKDKWIDRGLQEDDLDDMTGAEKDKYVRKDYIWPRPDYEDLVDNQGVDAQAAYLMKRVYDRMAAKPENSDEQIKYIQAVRKVRELAEAAKTVKDVEALQGQFNKAFDNSHELGRIIRQKRMYYSPLTISWQDKSAAEDAVKKEGFPHLEPWQRLFLIHEYQAYDKYSPNGYKTTFTIKTKGETKWPTGVERIYDSREKALEAVKQVYEQYLEENGLGKDQPKRPHLDFIERTGPAYRGANGRDIEDSEEFKEAFGFRDVEFGNWAAGDERQRLVNFAYDALHDLARVWGVPPKALSMNGKLALGFGSRGTGGKNAASAHYEPDRIVINVTKMHGAGSLAHEFVHVLDHAFGEARARYSGKPVMASGGRDVGIDYSPSGQRKLPGLSGPMVPAFNHVMNTIMTRPETPEEKANRIRWQLHDVDRAIEKWGKKLEDVKAEGNPRTIQAITERLKLEENRRENIINKSPDARVETDYYRNAVRLSGKAGVNGYWARPEELLARATESWVQDKIEAAGHKSQYLVHGTEWETHRAHPKGNPYPGQDERKAINRALDEFFHTLTTVQEHPGDNYIPEIAGKTEGEWQPLPPPTEITTDVEKNGPQVDGDGSNTPLGGEGGAAHQPSILADHFANHFAGQASNKFDTILAARKFAKEKGFDYDEKMVEEALELGAVKHARKIAAEYDPARYWDNRGRHDAYDKLVHLYDYQMPRLGTRTSTSVRDQAYSTPLPLAFLVDHLAKITNKTTVFEPTAGNGALLIGADPGLSVANELNPARAENLRQQGFVVRNEDAANDDIAAAKAFDAVLANPPFGTVKDDAGNKVTFDLSKIQPGYQTTQIDHAIALRALGALKEEGGRAVLILGGVSRMKATPEERREGYSSQDKRYFFKALYDRFNVTDHFTVDGDLYAKQGAAWPVDVVVINGRGKSALPLPALGIPRIYKSWEDLKDVLDNPRNNGQPAGPPHETTVEPEPESAGGHGGGGKPPRGPRPAPEPVEPGQVHPEPVSGGPGGDDTGTGGGEVAPQPGGGGKPPGAGGEPVGGGRPPGLGETDEDLEKAFDEEIDNLFGPEVPHQAVLDEAHEDGGIAATGGEDRAPPFDVAKDPEAAKEWVKGYDEQNEGVKTGGPRAPKPHKAGEPTGPGPIETPPPDKNEPFKRPSPEVIKEMFGDVSKAADEAMGALVEMFGGGKSISMGVTFDKDTYEKAKPKFKEAAENFAHAGMNASELVRRMLEYMQKVWGLAREALLRMRPYLLKFAQDVREGLIKLKTKAQEAVFERSTAEKKEKETELQVRYEPQSNAAPMDVLAPKNIADGMKKALAEIVKEKGDLDRWVAGQLDMTPEELQKALSAEQIDGVAIVVHNIQKQSAAILGDQTGMGKGRQIASAIVYALKNNLVPIFVTEKPNLYADIYRDLVDVGIEKVLGRKLRPLMTNQKEDIPLEPAPLDPDAPPAVVLKKSMGTKANLDRFQTAEDFRKEHDVLFTTYNQMQTINGDTHRRQLIRRLAPRAIIIFDESHNAGGQKATRGKVANPLLADRATFARQVQGPAQGVAYSSATYAKRADVMDLYLKTNMSKAVTDIKGLGDAISKGGIPMQQVVAAMLAADGQYIRRERSFDGITFTPKEIDVDRERYNNIATGMQLTNRFSISNARAIAIQKIKDEIAAEGGAVHGENQVQDSVTSINFTSVMHNLVNQMLLAMKAEPVAKMAIEALKNGQKPFVTFANTMESFLSQTASDLELKHGDVYKGDFRDVMKRYLERTRIVKIVKAHAPKGTPPELRRITDAELGPDGVAQFKRAYDHIDGIAGLDQLPVSPIDAIKQTMQDAGYKVGEITGRKLTLDYSDRKNPKLAPRKSYDMIIDGKKRRVSETSIVGRNKTVADYNNGDLDAILANQSGATGLSAHASEKFKDKRQRHMITAQPEGNIDTQMQMYGRVHRTGQVNLPTYTHAAANIPAETRPTAVLMKKLASLNANTTGARTGAFTMNVPDFLNHIGDRVAAQWVLDNPEEHAGMGSPVDINEDTGRPTVEDAMRILTGKTMLLSVEKQEQMMDDLIAGYNDALEAAEASGENTIEAKTLDFKAAPIERTMVVPQRDNSGSLFAQPVYATKVMARKLGKSWTPEEVMRRVVEPLQNYVPADTRPGEFKAGEYTPVRSMTFDDFFNRWEKNFSDKWNELASKLDKPPTQPKNIKDADPQQIAHIKSLYNAHFDKGYFGPYQKPEPKPVELTPENMASVLDELDTQATYNIKPLRQRAMDLAKARTDEWVAKYNEYRKQALDEIEEPAAQERKRVLIDGIKDRWTALNTAMMPGSRVTLMFGGKVGERERGVVVGVNKVNDTINPLSLGSWKVTFAIPTANKQIALPFSRLWPKDRANPNDDMAVEYAPVDRWIEDAGQTLKLFKDSQADVPEERYILTGNILAGFDWAKNAGLISHYTDDKGRIQQGIVMPHKWKLAEHAASQPTILRDPQEVVDWLRTNRPKVLSGEDDKGGAGVIRINADRHNHSRYWIDITGAKGKGGTYYLDPDLIQLAGGDFRSSGGVMRKVVDDYNGSKLRDIVARMQELGARFGIAGEAPKAEPIGPEEAAMAAPKGWDKAELDANPPETPEQRDEMVDQIVRLIDHLTGRQANMSFPDLLEARKNIVGYNQPEGRPLGAYSALKNLIRVAMADPRGYDRTLTALHEAWHWIQDRVMNPQERAILKREMPRLRAIVQKAFDQDVGKLADFEVEANAFMLYAGARINGHGNAGAGMHIGVRAFFERLWQLMRRLGNWLRGNGFENADDVFEKGLSGKMGQRPMQTSENSALRMEMRAQETKEVLARAIAPHEPEEFASMGGPRNYGNAPANKRVRGAISNLFSRSKVVGANEALHDFNARIQELEKAVEERRLGARLPEAQQAYELKRLVPGKTADRRREFNEKHVLPLDAFMRANDITQEAGSDWLQANAAEDRNWNTGAIHPLGHQFKQAMNDDTVVGGSGWSNQEARDHIKSVLSGPKAAAFQELSRRYADMRNWVNEERINTGLESLERIQEWARSEPNYATFTSWENPEEAREFSDAGYPGRGGDIKGPESKKAFGRSTKADNSIVGLIDQGYRTIDRGQKNLALQGLGRMLSQAPAGTNEALGYRLNRGRPIRKIDRNTGLVYTDDDYADRFRPNAVHFKVAGSPRYIVFDDPKLAEAAKRWSALGGDFMPLQIANQLVGRWKSLITHYNPEFMFRHALRYYVEGAMNATEDVKGRAYAKYLAESIPVFGKASRAIWNVEHGKNLNGQMEQIYQRMRAAGGMSSMFAMRDYDVNLQRLSAEATMIGKSNYNPKRLAQAVAKVVDQITSMIDNSIRLARAAAAIRAGKSDHEAAMLAREATVDYNLQGTMARWIGAFEPFQKVATATGVRQAKALTRSNRIRTAFAMASLAGFLIGAWNYFTGGEDSSKRAYFDQLPEWSRGKNIAMFLGASDSKGRPQPFYLPLPFGWAPPVVAGYALAGMLSGTMSAGRYIAETAMSMLSGFTPIGEERVGLRNFAPAILRPLADIAENKSWTGGKIHSEASKQFPQTKANAYTHFPWTPAQWDKTAEWINFITGGSQSKAGILGGYEPYPEDIQYLMNQWFGAQMRMVEKSAATGEGIAAGAPPNPTQVPMGSVVFGTDYDKGNQARAREQKRELQTPYLGVPSGPKKPLVDLSHLF